MTKLKPLMRIYDGYGLKLHKSKAVDYNEIFLFVEMLTRKMALEQYFLEEGKNVSDLSTMALIYRLFSDYRSVGYNI